MVRAAAVWLSARGVSPNAISVVGMVAGVVAGGALAGTGWICADGSSDVAVRLLALSAIVCVQLRLLCNLLDGLVAVEGGRKSAVGELYNEVPDRVSDTVTFVGAGFAIGGEPALGFVAAIVALLVAYVRAVGKGCGLAYDYCGPMAKQHRMAVLSAAGVVVVIAPGLGFSVPVFGVDRAIGPIGVALVVIIAGGLVTFVRRLVRLARRLRSAEA